MSSNAVSCRQSDLEVQGCHQDVTSFPLSILFARDQLHPTVESLICKMAASDS